VHNLCALTHVYAHLFLTHLYLHMHPTCIPRTSHVHPTCIPRACIPHVQADATMAASNRPMFCLSAMSATLRRVRVYRLVSSV
jgi:hypothetical protein